MSRYKMMFILCFVVLQSCNKKNKSSEIDNVVKQISIYTIGDSTMADKPNPDQNPERGWCQVLPLFLNNRATLKNHAVNGRSTRSFIAENRWDTVYNKLEEGDYVFIQFGHNDQKIKDPKRYTNPNTAYRNNLVKFVQETREKGANPILFTSIVRRKFNEFNVFIDTHKNYPLQVRLVAQELKVPLIDLQYLTEQLEVSYGVEESKRIHLHYQPNQVPYYPEGKVDDTHLSILGATEISKLVIEALSEQVEPFRKYIE